MKWSEEMARLDEMSQGRRSLQISIDKDGDIRVSICHDGMPISENMDTIAVVEFCSTAGGGGRSPRTRAALLALFTALEEDNKNAPEGIPPYPIHLNAEIKGKLGIP